MNKNMINIPVKKLSEYVVKNGVMWQMRDSLIEFSCAEGVGGASEDNKEYEVMTNEMLTVLADAESVQIFNHKLDDSDGFQDLIEWSRDGDTLILVDDELMLCIASCDKEQVLDMAV